MNEPLPPSSDPIAAPRLFALVPCAGRGSRAGLTTPKQYERLDGQLMVEHTVAALSAVARLAGILVVTAPGDVLPSEVDAIKMIAKEVHFSWANAAFDSKNLKIAVRRSDDGGATRAASVAGGLACLRRAGARDGDWVLVHDAARCLIAYASIDRLIDACLDDPVGGLLALPVADTVKVERSGTAGTTEAAAAVATVEPGSGSVFEGSVSARARVGATRERSGLWLAQTPQMFRIELLERALASAAAAGAVVTDEASAVERLGLAPRLIVGDALNLKITWPGDLAVAEAILRSRTA